MSSLPRIHAEVGRLERITVCTRPFRAQGPRIEAERLGDKLLVHHYGHGGSGWSLSWGSAALVRPMALADGAREVAVIGGGAIGLTTALTLQRAGARVAIYARELPPDVRSSRATGLWSPDSRFALAQHATEAFAARWEQMAYGSWTEFQRVIDRGTGAVAFHDRYLLSELPPDEEIAARHREDPVGFAHLESRLSALLPALYSAPLDRGPGEHPFPTAFCRQLRTLKFNISAYSQELLGEFRDAGGTVQVREFHAPAELAALPQPVIVNCTGYGARALFGDVSLTPVRGQIGWLPAQPEVQYSLLWRRLSVVSRGDGIVVQVGASSDGTGWNEADEQPDRAESEQAVRWLAALQGD